MQDWNYFLKCWNLYKKSTGITGDTILSELLECCSEELDRDIHRVHYDIDTKSEKEILEAMKERAVIIENPVVAQVTHLNMKQGRVRRLGPGTLL